MLKKKKKKQVKLGFSYWSISLWADYTVGSLECDGESLLHIGLGHSGNECVMFRESSGLVGKWEMLL